jgi:hypothetical protein
MHFEVDGPYAVLEAGEVGVESSDLTHEFIVPSPLDDLSPFEDEDLIGSLNGGEPMGDHEDRSAHKQALEGALNESLGF